MSRIHELFQNFCILFSVITLNIFQNVNNISFKNFVNISLKLFLKFLFIMIFLLISCGGYEFLQLILLCWKFNMYVASIIVRYLVSKYYLIIFGYPYRFS